ncbi:MAG: long-chain fatty acid--CoA ligase [Actinobacteria bacterium]|nr:long-chain fatty acid--CoA ligase [Actinomycetota bacterium]
MNLARIGEFWARWRPEELSIKYAGVETTWRELDVRTSHLAAGLAGRGIAKGDRIGLLLTNCMEWIELTIAAWKLGALIVPINTRFTPAEVKFVTANAGAKLLFTNDGLADSAKTVEGCEVIRVEHIAPLYADGSTILTADTVPDDAAFICYTSGTTGDPKGAVLTHGSFNAGSQSWAQALDLWPGDKLQLPFPLAFTGGLALWLYTYWSGASLLLDNEVNIDRIYDNFEKERATGFMAVPTIFQMIVDHPRWKTADLSAWKKACSGGAVVPPSLLKAVQARDIPMLQMFSLTESSAAGTVLPSHDAFRKVGSAGIPINHGSLKIADDDDNEIATGEVGEILLRGPQVMKGYWNNPEATAAALRGGWLHTGDLGYVDDEGYLYVVDRKKDMLISGGLNVYPAELERLIANVPGVVEVAVVGVPDDHWGETPLVIVFTNGAKIEASDILDVCRDNLADFKLPRYLHVTQTPLPRNMSGKILKRELKIQFADFPKTARAIR